MSRQIKFRAWDTQCGIIRGPDTLVQFPLRGLEEE